DRFGQSLLLYEVTGPKLHVAIWRDQRRYPGSKAVPGPESAKIPYFVPGQQDGWWGISRTYFDGPDATRPTRLFEVATSHLIYCTVAGNPDFNSGYRPAAWAEAGLGRYLEHSMTGAPSRAAIAAWQCRDAEARIVLARPERDLAHVSRYDSKKYWGGVSDENVFEFPAAELAVAFILEAAPARDIRDGFFRYLLEVLRPVKGSSSTALDRNLGRPIEELDAPWHDWIREQIEPPTPAIGRPGSAAGR
ncbi:MAG: hypothetical protein KDC98_14935, partial [Planctomycetes bacterium]|nr:hypothetical protein [Planctomycetota bacterium]